VFVAMTALQIKTWLTRHRYLLLTLALLLLVEIIFDAAESVLGRMMVYTNSFRPKVGRLWVEEEKDVAAKQQVTSIVDSLSNHPFRSAPMRRLEDLSAYLNYKNRIIIPRNDFLALYRAFPDSEARQLADPILLEELARDNNWQNTGLTNSDGQITCIFTDGFGQPLLVTHLVDSTYEPRSDTAMVSQLEQDNRFTDRLVKPQLFLAAFDRLPRRLQLQLVNDPAFFSQGQEKLLMVGIASFIQNGCVTIACEMKTDEASVVRTFSSSNLAVNYLIMAINEIGRHEIELALPQKEVER
jgi:hypothetical protein